MLQTQSLPTGPLPTLQRLQHWDKPAATATSMLLSDDETDSESERGGDTLSSEDQQLLAAFIRLNRERKAQALKQRAATQTTAPVLIPTHARRCYEPSSEELWALEAEDEDEDECPNGNDCSVCWRKDMLRFSTGQHAPLPTRHLQTDQNRPDREEAADRSDLLFDLEM